MAYFFEDVSANMVSGTGSGPNRFTEVATPFDKEKDPFIKLETLELVSAYYRFRELRIRKRIYEMVKAVAAASL